MWRHLSALALVLCFASAAHAQTGRFVELGDLPGGGFRSEARGVSGDGTVVVGMSASAAQPGGEAFRWTSAEKMVPLGSLTPFLPFSAANAASEDGSVIVGTTRSPRSAVEAFVFTEEDGMEGIGFLPGFNFSQALDVTVNPAGETVVVGFSRLVLKEAFRWTETGGMQGLGFAGGFNNSRVLGVSRNGNALAGFHGEVGTSAMEAFRWTVSSQTFKQLGFLDGGSMSDANAISGDGKVVVGGSAFAGASGAGTQAFRWRLGDMHLTPLGLLAGAESSEALDASFDGGVIVGTSGGRAFVWNAQSGIRDLQTALGSLVPANWILLEATGVTSDGLTVVGNALNEDGDPEGFLATLAPPAKVGDVRPIATGQDFTCAIGSDMALGCWGNFAADPDPGAKFTQVTAGETHICAIRTNGSLGCFGTDGGTGKTVPPGDAFVRVSAGGDFTCGVRAGGSIKCFGMVPDLQPPGGNDFVDIGAGREHACAVRSDGSVVCFGADTQGPAPADKRVPPPSLLRETLTKQAVQVAAGDEHTCAVLSDETLKCWGEGTGGLGDGQATPDNGTYSFVAAGSFHTCGIRTPFMGEAAADEVVCFGRSPLGFPADDGRSKAPADVSFVAVDAGGMGTADGHTCGIQQDGVRRCWGVNTLDAACPPGDEADCDGLPDPIDNCPDDFNPAQIDLEEDGIGDVCDLCVGEAATDFDPDGNALSQADEDEDGIGDLCDPCLGNPNPECNPFVARLVEVQAPLVLGEFVQGVAPPPAQFDLVANCGSHAVIRKVALALLLPMGTLAGDINFGNNCDRPENGGCPDTPDPTRISSAVDLTSPDSFVRKPGDPALPGSANPDALYFSLRSGAEPADPLCSQDEMDVFLARLTIGSLPAGFEPPFTNQGAEDAVGAAAESDTGNLDDSDVELQGGASSEDARVRIVLQPADADLDPNGNRWSVGLEAEVPLDRVLVGFQGNGTISYLGCNASPSDPCNVNPSQLVARDCATGGGVPGALTGQHVDLTSANTFIFLPASAAALGPLAADGVQPNTLYVSVEGQANLVTGGSTRALNPLATDPDTGELIRYQLGTVEFAPAVPPPAGQRVAPSLVFSGLQALFETDQNSPAAPFLCDTESPFTPFQVTDDFLADNAAVSESQRNQVFTFGQDPDGDNWLSDFDDCPFTANPPQLDTGGVESPFNFEGLDANGVGDECECGDVAPESFLARVVDSGPNRDADVMLDIIAGNPPPGVDPDRCSTAGGPGCGPEDWVATKRSHAGLPGGIEGKCPAALP